MWWRALFQTIILFMILVENIESNCNSLCEMTDWMSGLCCGCMFRKKKTRRSTDDEDLSRPRRNQQQQQQKSRNHNQEVVSPESVSLVGNSNQRNIRVNKQNNSQVGI